MGRRDGPVKSPLWRRLSVLAAISISAGAHGAELTAGATGIQHDVVFTQYSPLSRSTEITLRLLSPLANAEVARVLAQSAAGLREQDIRTVQIAGRSVAHQLIVWHAGPEKITQAAGQGVGG